MAAIAKEVFEALFVNLESLADRKAELTIQAKEARNAFLAANEGLEKKVLAKLYRDWKELRDNEEKYVADEFEKDQYINMFLTPTPVEDPHATEVQ